MGDLQNITNLTVAISVFGFVLAMWLGVVLFWAIRRSTKSEKLEQRLGLHPQGGRVLRLWRDGKESTTTIDTNENHASLKQRLDRLHQNAGWVSPLQTIFLGLLGVVAIVSAIILVLSHNWLASLAGGAGVVLIFWAYVTQRVMRRETLFERQFLEAIGLASRSLRAGHPLTGAFRLISDEIGPPVGETFKNICQQQEFGASLETALRNAATISNSHDMKIFATSVIMQLRSGGNLAEVMDRLGLVIRDRIRLNRRVRILTAQTQLSKRVLLALPIIVFILVNILNPHYMEPLYTTQSGKIMIAIGAAGLLFGAWVMNRVGKVRY
ncbi:MAG: type II secretion system F family protein [Planctomycetota bacterium]